MKRFLLFIWLVFISAYDAMSQAMPVDDASFSSVLTPIGSVFNRVFNDVSLDSFYIKLGVLKKKKQGIVRIVQIGDSHIQAGYFTGQIRDQMQQFFGNAGRGLVFPYEVVNTNSPVDFNSYSGSGWKVSKVAANGDKSQAGISGFGLKTANPGASFTISLTGIPSEVGFTRIKVFTDSDPNGAWLCKTNTTEVSLMIKNQSSPSTPSTVVFPSLSTELSLSAIPSTHSRSFFGVSLEKDQPGLIYHAIGVNGARYDQYNEASAFWQQLPGLEADLFIVSLGTNDAQKNKFDEKDFKKNVSIFIQKLRKASPRAAILVTTAPDSYRGGRPNMVLKLLNLTLFEYCTEQGIAVWDLYRVTNGYGSAYDWLRRGYMNNDMVHFTPDGYKLQAQLLFNAIAKGYNAYHGF